MSHHLDGAARWAIAIRVLRQITREETVRPCCQAANDRWQQAGTVRRFGLPSSIDQPNPNLIGSDAHE